MRGIAAACRVLLAIGVLACAGTAGAGSAGGQAGSGDRIYRASLSVKGVWHSTLARQETLSTCTAEVQADAIRTLAVRSTRPVTVVFHHGRLVGAPLLRVSGLDATAGSNVREETCDTGTTLQHSDCVPLKHRFLRQTLRLRSLGLLDVTPQRFTYRPFDPEGECFVEPAAAQHREPGLARIHIKVPGKELVDPTTTRIVLHGVLTSASTQPTYSVDETLTWKLTLTRST